MPAPNEQIQEAGLQTLSVLSTDVDIQDDGNIDYMVKCRVYDSFGALQVSIAKAADHVTVVKPDTGLPCELEYEIVRLQQ